MSELAFEKDYWKRPLGERFTLALQDLDFEKRLKAFDKNLRLFFHKQKKKWAVVEKRLDGLWNIVFYLEDRDGRPKGVGDWVLNKLFVMRKKHYSWQENRILFHKNDEEEILLQKKQMDKNAREESRLMILDDIITFKKAIRQMQGLPTSDVTAGYRKVK